MGEIQTPVFCSWLAVGAGVKNTLEIGSVASTGSVPTRPRLSCLRSISPRAENRTALPNDWLLATYELSRHQAALEDNICLSISGSSERTFGSEGGWAAGGGRQTNKQTNKQRAATREQRRPSTKNGVTGERYSERRRRRRRRTRGGGRETGTWTLVSDLAGQRGLRKAVQSCV